MKLESSFKNFLKNAVNLNETRYQTARSAIDTMSSILQNDSVFGRRFIDVKPQGSFRQETIIKPVDPDLDFDVDLLFEMEIVDGWSPADYLTNLSEQLKKLDRYKDKIDTRGKARCVTIDYENDFHVDIVPAVTIGTQCFVMNKSTNQYEITDGDGYAQWFSGRNAITGKKYLTKTARLLKYVRDTGGKFDVKSILLTTLLGNQVLATDGARDYPDLPTTFVKLLSRLDVYLQNNPLVPSVANPVLSTEYFNRHLDQEKYAEFRDAIHSYSERAVNAYNEIYEEKSLKKWQGIFGDLFTGITEDRSLAVSINGLQLADFSHKEEPAFPVLRTSATVNISASLYWGRHDYRVINRRYQCSFNQKSELPRYHWLKYVATTDYNEPYDVYWQVVNTGESARQANGLRGQIEIGVNEKWERSLYTGVHWVECFIVDCVTNQCVCRSGPFYVGFRERASDVPN